MKTLYVLVGIPGSGKSTIARKNQLPSPTLIVSRDDIRFLLVNENEPYFSKEKEVFHKFVEQIKEGLTLYDNVIADATHINTASRTKLLRALGTSLRDVNVVALVVQASLETAIQHNEHRKFTRAYVPAAAIQQMYKSFTMPTIEEGFNEILIKENNNNDLSN